MKLTKFSFAFLALVMINLLTSGYSYGGYDDYFVNAGYLKENIDKSNLVIVDAREGNVYDKGHIKGAVPIRWKEISNLTPEFAQRGWGTLTDKEKLSKVIAESGIDENSEVIIYADTLDGWGEEGRIFWSLKIAGIENIRMLDGGIYGWEKNSGKLFKDIVKRKRSSFQVKELNFNDAIDTKTLKENYLNFKIIDSRTLKEYEGARKFGEKRGGHLPGAILIPYKSLLNDGYLKKPSELIKLIEEKGISKSDRLVTYCTAGIRSAYVQVVLKMLGYDIKNYDESFYVWANEKDTGLGIVSSGINYNYVTVEQLKKFILKSKNPILVDIQKKEDYQKFHFENSIGTGAYPVKSETDLMKLKKILPQIRNTKRDIIIINPDDEESSIRAFTYFSNEGVNTSRLYILGRGKKLWGLF